MENPTRLQLALMLNRRFTQAVKNIQVIYKEAGNNSLMLEIFMVCLYKQQLCWQMCIGDHGEVQRDDRENLIRNLIHSHKDIKQTAKAGK